MSTTTTLVSLPSTQGSPTSYSHHLHSPLPPSPSIQEEAQEVLEEVGGKLHFTLQGGSTQKRQRSIRMDLGSKKPLSPIRFTSTPRMIISEPDSPLQSYHSPSSSPIERFFKRIPSLSRVNIASPFYKSTTTDMVDDKPDSLRKLHRQRSRSKSTSMHHHHKSESPSFWGTFAQDDLRPTATEEKNLSSTVNQSRRTAPSTNTDEEVAKAKVGNNSKPSIHFRPIPYEVKAELDNFFGQTKIQKRELALRTKGEDGHLWFDRIEQEEFAHLLSSTPNTPIHMSRRSSVATSLCRSPNDSYSRRQSNVSSCPLITPKSPTCQDVATYTYLPMYSFGAPSEATDSFDVSDPSERRRKRSKSDLMRFNTVVDHQPLQADFGVEEVHRGRTFRRENADISMPAFLPLRRQQASAALLDEAFTTNSCSRSKDSQPSSPPPSLTNRLESKGRKRPADLQFHFKDMEDLGIASPHQKIRPMSMTVSPSPNKLNNPFEEGGKDSARSRAASFDLSCSTSSPRETRSQPMSFSKGRSLEPEYHLRSNDRTAKAATILGKHAGNENLLVPGGLPTGEQVYDGVDIPCRSVHLASDDEDDDFVKEKKSLSNGVKKWLKSKTS